MGYEIQIQKWPDRETTNLDKLLSAIKNKIYLAYLGGITQDITPEIKENWIDFSFFSILQEYMAFGGIQEVGLKGYLSQVKHKGTGDNFDQFGKIYHDATILEIRLEFILKDWFGVDEEDVYKNTTATQMARDALAAF